MVLRGGGQGDVKVGERKGRPAPGTATGGNKGVARKREKKGGRGKKDGILSLL